MGVTVTPLPDLTLYGRAGCGLCAEARTLVLDLLAARAARGLPVPTFIERDIESDHALEREFFATIPVVELGARRIETVIGPAAVRRLLAEGLDAAPSAPDPTAPDPVAPDQTAGARP